MLHPFSLLLVQCGLIIGLSRLLGFGSKWIGQPLVIAEVVAGILLGPSFLGWLWPSAQAALFPPQSLPSLGLVSQVGLTLFMFLVGLELDPALLRGRGRTSVAISLTSIVVPFGLGVTAAYFWLYRAFSSPEVPFLSFVLFLGVAMSITAFPVLARILSERGMMRTQVGAIAITCAAVDDVTGWGLLALVISIVRASRLSDAALTVVWAAVFTALSVWAVRPLLGRLLSRWNGPRGLSQNGVAVVLLLLVASSLATELIGIHALFGAFLLGAIVPKEGGLAHALTEKFEDVSVVLLLPLFFAYSGLRTRLGLLDSPQTWWACGLIIALACAGKFGGSALAARLGGMGWREAGAVGVLVNTRGLMELVVLNVGLDLGVISPTLFTLMVLMALVTTFITSPLLAVLYPVKAWTAAQERGAAAVSPG